MDAHHEHDDAEHGYLLLADISGFDAYLADVELEHAQDVTAELLELIIASLSPPLRISGIHRDAVMAFQPEGDLTRGETLLELTETAYVAFRDRIKSIARNNTCTCRACAAIPTLDLKFLVHFGEYAARPGDNGRVALGGLDADLVRERLLKEQAAEGSRSYALFTEASLAHMGIRPEGMEESCGEYPHLGEIRANSINLGDRYESLSETRTAYVTAEEADVVISHEFSHSAPVVWEWLNDPNRRTQWLRWTKWRPGLRPGGRTGVGAVNHCTHGIGSVVETVLEWRPYRFYTVEMRQASMWTAILATYALEPLPDGRGTHLTMSIRLQEAPAMALTRPTMKPFLSWKMKQDFVRMGQLMGDAGDAPAVPPAAESESAELPQP